MDAHPWRRANSTDRSIITFAPPAASSSISSYEIASSLRARVDEPRVGREDAVDVGEDLAPVRSERGGERDRGRVRAAAAERRHVARRRDALEAGDEHDRAFLERGADAGARISTIFALVCAVSVTIPACEPVSEIAR